MKRRYDWRSRLHRTLGEVQARPFAWGTWDCAVFANTCVQAMTGESLLSALGVPPYGDAAGAMAALAGLGYPDLEALLAAHFEAAKPSYAYEGDIAVIDAPLTGTALGIVLGERIGVVTEHGYGTVPRSHMKAAYRVP